MAQGLWAKGSLWEGSQAFSIPGAISTYDASVCDNMLGKFTSTALRNSALAALPEAQREGCMAWVTDLGLFVYSGSTWWPVPIGNQHRFFSGIVSTNASGDISVPCGMFLAGGLTAVPFPTAMDSAIGGDAQALGAGAVTVARWTSNSSTASTATFRIFFAESGLAWTSSMPFAFTAQMVGH